MNEQARVETEGIKVWLDDGILYIEYSKKVTLDVILESQKMGLDLVNKNNIDIVPLILIYEGEARSGIELSALDIAKLMTMVEAYHHLSRIFVINAGEEHHKVGDIFNKIFMGGKLQYCASLEAAQAEAKKALAAPTHLLETDHS